MKVRGFALSIYAQIDVELALSVLVALGCCLKASLVFVVLVGLVKFTRSLYVRVEFV